MTFLRLFMKRGIVFIMTVRSFLAFWSW